MFPKPVTIMSKKCTGARFSLRVSSIYSSGSILGMYVMSYSPLGMLSSSNCSPTTSALTVIAAPSHTLLPLVMRNPSSSRNSCLPHFSIHAVHPSIEEEKFNTCWDLVVAARWLVASIDACCKRIMDGRLNFGVVAIVFNSKSVQKNEGNSVKSTPVGAALNWVPQ